jgi:ComF family protein
MYSLAQPIVRTLADLISPERCAACRTIVADGAIFCHACRAHVNVLAPPECITCGEPRPATRCCTACAHAPDPTVRHARAWASYRVGCDSEPVVRALTSFKYDGVTRLARRMARVMAARVPDPSVSLIVPVPLHRRRLRARGFNQSALLARHLGRLLRRPVRTNVVLRIHDAPSQTTRSGAERRRGTAGAFRVARPAAVRDRRALVVDDVWTSGATARAVAAALRAAGALSVDVVTFARVVGARAAR